MRPILSALALIAFCSSGTAVHAGGFIGEIHDFPQTDHVYDIIWNRLQTYYGHALPETIEIVKHTFEDGSSRFRADTNPMSVWMNPKSYIYGTAAATIAHESAHLAHWRMTAVGNEAYARSYRNEFRFIDEGMANIVGSRAVDGEALYRRKVGAAVFFARQANRITLRQIQNWYNKPKSEGEPGIFDSHLPSYHDYDNSYEIGSSFVYYLESLATPSRVKQFIVSFRKTIDLATSLAQVYGDALSSEPSEAYARAEKGWRAYIDTIAFEPRVPQVVSRFPEQNSKDIPCSNLNQVSVTFDQPMNKSIINFDTTTSSQYGIYHQKAAWSSDKNIVIAVDKTKLVPGVVVRMTIGYDGPQGYYPMKSDQGVPAPVTPWSFSCAASK